MPQTKRLFNGTQPTSVIHFGRNGDNDRTHDIIKGKLSLSTSEVSSTFNDVVARIVSSCRKLLRGQQVKVSFVYFFLPTDCIPKTFSLLYLLGVSGNLHISASSLKKTLLAKVVRL